VGTGTLYDADDVVMKLHELVDVGRYLWLHYYGRYWLNAEIREKELLLQLPHTTGMPFEAEVEVPLEFDVCVLLFLNCGDA
jgi:hypothetical protein